MSDTTIFKLSDLGITTYSQIKVKSKKNGQTSIYSNIIHNQLEAPVISLSGDVISWSAINYADLYEIYNSDTKIAETSNTSYDLSQLSLSDAIIRVKAIANSIYSPSDYSNSVYYNYTFEKATVSNLGTQNPENLIFTKYSTFDAQSLNIEEVTVGSNVFIKIPTMYRKVNTITDNQITSFTIANGQIDGSYEPYPCFLDENNNLLPYILIGKYINDDANGCSSINPASSQLIMGIAEARQYARNVGRGYQLFDWQIYKLWQDLTICITQTITGGLNNNVDCLGIDFTNNAAVIIDGVLIKQGDIYISYKPSEYIGDKANSSDLDLTNYSVLNYALGTYATGNSKPNQIKSLGYDSNHKFANFASSAHSSNSQYYCSSGATPSQTSPFYLDTYYSTTNNNFYGVFSTINFSLLIPGGQARLCYRPI